MSQDDLDALLSRMPDIATAVNGFNSEAIQQQAFKALIEAYGVALTRETPQHATGASEPDKSSKESSRVTSAKAQLSPEDARRKGPKSRKSTSSGTKDKWNFLRDLDVQPAGKLALKELLEQKQPKSNEDRFAVLAYWFEDHADFSEVTISHLGSAIRMLGMRQPSDLTGALTVTASRKGTLDTSKLPVVRLTTHGRNLVEHDLPRKAKAK